MREGDTTMNELITKSSADLANVIYLEDVINNNPFAEVFAEKSENTRKRYSKELRNFGAFLYPAAPQPPKMLQPADWKGVTAQDIREYKNYLLYTRGLSVSSVNQTVFIVRSFGALSAAYDGMSETEVFKATQKAKGIKSNAAENINELRGATRASKKKETATIITKYQAERLKNEHADDMRGRRDALLMRLLLDLGLRISDVIALTMENINMETRTISLTTKKTKTPLNLYMTDDIYNAAVEYFEYYTPPTPPTAKTPIPPIWYGTTKSGRRIIAHWVDVTDEYGNILYDENGEPLKKWEGFNKHSAQMRVTALGAALGIEKFSAHDCRHYWVTAADKGGSSLLAITEAGGWTSPTMPMRYVNKSKISNSGINLA